MDFDTILIFKAEFQWPIKYSAQHLLGAESCNI